MSCPRLGEHVRPDPLEVGPSRLGIGICVRGQTRRNSGQISYHPQPAACVAGRLDLTPGPLDRKAVLRGRPGAFIRSGNPGVVRRAHPEPVGRGRARYRAYNFTSRGETVPWSYEHGGRRFECHGRWWPTNRCQHRRSPWLLPHGVESGAKDDATDVCRATRNPQRR